MENRLRSNGKVSQDLRHWRSSRRSRKTCKVETLNLKILAIESSSCQLSDDIEWKNRPNNVFQIPNTSSVTWRDSRKDSGHSLDRETKRSGTGLSVFHPERKLDSTAHRWWYASTKPVTQYSRASVLWVVEFWQERRTETPYTSMRMLRTQNSYFERFAQQISSVSTEQSQADEEFVQKPNEKEPTSDRLQRFQDEIPGQTTVGPVLQAHIPYLGINEIQIQIPSTTTPDRNSWVVICRRKNRYVDELHLNDLDHHPTISKLRLERFIAKESELCSTEMEQSHIGETHATQFEIPTSLVCNCSEEYFNWTKDVEWHFILACQQFRGILLKPKS